jgi:hypothetical protein
LKGRDLFTKKELWMLCNKRPFFAEYRDRRVIFELNGWSFLKKDRKIWEDLKDCDFYDSRNSELIFYCPKNFNTPNLTAKIYRFDKNSFKMKKTREENFLDLIAKDISKPYPFLSNCKITQFTPQKESSLSIVRFTFDCPRDPSICPANSQLCQVVNYQVSVDFSTRSIKPPLIFIETLPLFERVNISFNKLLGCMFDKTLFGESFFLGTSNCKEARWLINYNLSDDELIHYSITCPEEKTKTCLENIGSYFLFPPLQLGEKEIEFLKRKGDNSFETLFYKAKDQIIFLFKSNEKVMVFGRRNEGLWFDEENFSNILKEKIKDVMTKMNRFQIGE